MKLSVLVESFHFVSYVAACQIRFQSSFRTGVIIWVCVCPLVLGTITGP